LDDFALAKKTRKNMIFYWTGTKEVCILSVLFALIVLTHTAASGTETPVQDGKTGIRAKVLVKESRVLNKLTLVEDELEALRKEKFALEYRLTSLEAEREVLRKELIENIKRYKLQEDSYRRLQLGIAAKIGDSGKVQATANEQQLLGALRKLSDDCVTLTLAVNEYCDFMEGELEKSGLSDTDAIKLRLAALRKKASMANTVAKPYPLSGPVSRCRILAVNDKLRVVILSAGLAHGVRNGLNWFGGEGNNCRLQVVAARSELSAAVLVDGNLKELAPGMEVSTGSEKEKN
jgi:hypothetical protein